MEKTKFIKYHVPCPECGSSDAVSVNSDGSAKCFSCSKFFPNFEGGDIKNLIEENVTKEQYSRFLFNKSVFNLHSKGAIRFYTRGNECVKLIDKDGLIYYIGSQRANELVQIIEKQLKIIK